MLATDVTDTCREWRVAIPSTGGDVYQQHQLVWQAMRGTGDHIREFIYAMQSPHVAVVRSRQFRRGAVSEAYEGPLRICIVSARQVEYGGLQALGVESTLELAERLIGNHGIVANDLRVECQSRLRGTKVDRNGARPLHIVLPVSELVFHGRFTNRARAAIAWANGIGRGKRFGCGMLRKAF